ncbi:hypothetical protein M1O54_04715 [Dehalococcoidia bacterium]|nr:hypothetical protein [Dehalococcoidia bacterium]
MPTCDAHAIPVLSSVIFALVIVVASFSGKVKSLHQPTQDQALKPEVDIAPYYGIIRMTDRQSNS